VRNYACAGESIKAVSMDRSEKRAQAGISDEMTLSSIERFVFLSFEALKVKDIETQT